MPPGFEHPRLALVAGEHDVDRLRGKRSGREILVQPGTPIDQVADLHDPGVLAPPTSAVEHAAGAQHRPQQPRPRVHIADHHLEHRPTTFPSGPDGM